MRLPKIDITWRRIGIILIWVVIWLKLFDLVSVKAINKWHDFFSYYDGYRLPASVAAFIPFTRKTIQADTSYSIIFTGDSTSGGLLYHHSQAIPAYLNNELNTAGKTSHVYNLPMSGAHLSEQYLIMKELSTQAEMFVFPIHYSFFSGRGENNSFITHPELIDFLDTATQDDVALLNLKVVSMPEKLIRNSLAKVWYTYSVHRLLPYVTLGKPVKFWIHDKVNDYIPLYKPPNQKQVSINPAVSFQQQSLEVQNEILKQNRFLWQKMQPIDMRNINMQYLVKIGKLINETRKPILAYFVPLDIKTLESIPDFDTSSYNQIIGLSKQVLNEWHIPYIDFNAGNPAQLTSEDFYNPDHLLPIGNQKVARVLKEEIYHDF